MGNTRVLHFMSRILGIFAAITMLAIVAAASTTQIIYTFAGDEDGEYTDTDLVVDVAGNIYGTSVLGGTAGGAGTVWQLAPSGSGWVHTVLYSFTGGADGGEPYKGVTLDADGNIYGTTVTGGGGSCEGGCGVVFKLTNTGGTWTYSTIHTFTGGADGSGPGSGLTFDKVGNIYGVTPTAGANGLGTIYQLKPQQDGTWKLKVLHAFTGGKDGSSGSAGRLLLGAANILYGVATTGGDHQQGTAYQLTQSANGKWSFKPIYAFKGTPDVGFPYGGLLIDITGNLYGTSYYDGAHDFGGVYQLSPAQGGGWREKVLYSFKGGKDGSGSIGNLVSDRAGNLFGTTSEDGAGYGTIFQLAPSGNRWHESVAYRFMGAPDGGSAYNGMVLGPNGAYYGATVHGGPTNDGTIYQFTP